MKVTVTAPEWVHHKVPGYEVRYYVWGDGFTEIAISREEDWKCVDYAEGFFNTQSQLDEVLAMLWERLPTAGRLTSARRVVKVAFDEAGVFKLG